MSAQTPFEPGKTIELVVSADDHRPERLDRFLAREFKDYSRTFFQALIHRGLVCLNGVIQNHASAVIRKGDTISFTVPVPEKTLHDPIQIRALPVEVVYEHEHFLIISKPAGLSTHRAGTRCADLTLADWIVCNYPALAEEFKDEPDRPGIVHRLDKDTSGLMIIARTRYAYKQFVDLFKSRGVHKTYNALVRGHPPAAGTIDFNIERHATIPTRMTHRIGSGREAVTHYRVLEYVNDSALLELTPLTGRTHQIRVHCAAIGNPIVGDTVYGTKSPLIRRQALHAAHLTFCFDGQSYEFRQPLPADLQEALKHMRALRAG